MEQVSKTDEKEDRKTKRRKKRLMKAAVTLTAILTVTMVVTAWFSNQRQLDTITQINAPTTLVIGAGNKEASSYIDLGEIDVTKVDENTKQGKSDYVFCVYSESVLGSYKLQLAHTTNIPFTYTIYKATDNTSAENGTVTYHSTNENKDYYYLKDTEVKGEYKNLKTDEEPQIANDTYHKKTYENYDKVQKNAEPLYWQTTNAITPTSAGNGFTDYYILELTWVGNLQNDKETDMVYITASMTSTTTEN